MKIILIIVNAYHRLLLWNAEIEVHSAEVVVLEAEAEAARAAQLLAHNTRRMLEARQLAADSWWRIERRGLLTRWGVK